MVFLNATACYLLAYQLVTYVAQAGTVAAARRVGVPGTWGLEGIHFELSDSAWQRNMVLEVYSAGPALVLALGLLAFGVFWKWQRQRRGPGKLFLLWIALHALNAVFGGLLADTVTQSGSWYVPNWFIGAGGIWPSTVLGLLLGTLQLGLGFLATIPFLLAQDSRIVLPFKRRAQLIRYTIIGPWLAGSVLLGLSKLPHLSVNEGLHFATLALLLVPLALGCRQESFSKIEVLPRATRIAWGLVGLALLALLAWRLALGVPVPLR